MKTIYKLRLHAVSLWRHFVLADREILNLRSKKTALIWIKFEP